jgi:hypothetical protein
MHYPEDFVELNSLKLSFKRLIETANEYGLDTLTPLVSDLFKNTLSRSTDYHTYLQGCWKSLVDLKNSSFNYRYNLRDRDQMMVIPFDHPVEKVAKYLAAVVCSTLRSIFQFARALTSSE